MEFKCNILQAFNTLQLSQEVQTFTLETWWDIWDFHGKNHSLWMFNDIYWIKDNATRMLGECQTRFSFTTRFWKRTMVIYWSWFREEVVLYQWRQTPRSIWTTWLKGCCWTSKKVIAQFSVLRAHCPEVDSKPKGILSVSGNTTQTAERPGRPAIIDESKISREDQRAE